MNKLAPLTILVLGLFLSGCGKTPTHLASVDESPIIEVLSPDGTVRAGQLVSVRGVDGSLRQRVVLQPAVSAGGFAFQPAVYRPDSYQDTSRQIRYAPAPAVRRSRSVKKSALIIGGSAGAGALVGGLAKGKKGAAIGALAGGLGGLAYDLITRR